MSPDSNTTAVVADDSIYHVKWINFNETKLPIVLQTDNGPCPLLAIINVLLLRGQIELPNASEIVSGWQLMERLADCILRLAPENLPEHLRTDYEQNVSDAVSMLNKLKTGLDVNVKFTGISTFEYTNECVVFDLLGIPLYHGWLVDPQQTQLCQLIGNKSYNQLVESIIVGQNSTNVDEQTNALLIGSFLDSTASQLTYHGLCELNTQLRDGELAVFFRNNHFSTLLKNRDELFSLITDFGFANEKSVVWETLNSVDGNSHFVTAQFHTATSSSATQGESPSAVDNGGDANKCSLDAELAKSLQAEENRRYELELQQQQQQRGASAPTPIPNSGSSLDQQQQHRRNDNKCRIL